MSIDWIQGTCAVPDARVRAAALARQEQLTKPPGALGRLEQLAVQLAAWQRNEHPTVQRIWIAVYAADPGVAHVGQPVQMQAAGQPDPTAQQQRRAKQRRNIAQAPRQPAQYRAE